MATKQEIEQGTALNLAGTVPGGHGLGAVRQRLLDTPRERQWVIGEVVSGGTNIKHPPDVDDKYTPTMQFVEMTGITDTADCDQLAAMATRARAKLMGQRTFDEADAEDPDEADGGSGVSSTRFLSPVVPDDGE